MLKDMVLQTFSSLCCQIRNQGQSVCPTFHSMTVLIIELAAHVSRLVLTSFKSHTAKLSITTILVLPKRCFIFYLVWYKNLRKLMLVYIFFFMMKIKTVSYDAAELIFWSNIKNPDYHVEINEGICLTG